MTSPGLPPAPRASGPIKLLIAASALGFFGLLGLRVQGRLLQQATIAREREESKARAQGADKELPKAVVTRGERSSWRPSVPVEGTLLPWHEADLGFKASGRLASVRVKVGDQIKSGAVLTSLDGAEAGAQQRAAQAQLKA